MSYTCLGDEPPTTGANRANAPWWKGTWSSIRSGRCRTARRDPNEIMVDKETGKVLIGHKVVGLAFQASFV